MPDSVSEQLKLTVAFVVFHPAELGAGETLAEMLGLVSSILTFTLAVAVTPALFVAVPLTTWFAPCVVTETGDGQLCIPTFVSVQVNETVTLELFHPEAFGGGVIVPVMTGGGGELTVAVVLDVPVTPRPSSTFNVTVNVPAEEYVWLGVAPVPVAPSPKFQL